MQWVYTYILQSKLIAMYWHLYLGIGIIISRFFSFVLVSGVSRLQKLVGPINFKCLACSAENFSSDHAHFRSIP